MVTTYDRALAYLTFKTTPKFVFYTVQGGYDKVIESAIEVAQATGDFKTVFELNEEGREHVQ